MQAGLSVGDGFKFGCGFLLAMLVFYLVMMAISAVIMLLMAFLGVLGSLAAIGPQTLLPILPLV